MSDHYQTLGVGRDASPGDIKAAHRHLAQQHHPDKSGDIEAFQALQQAYDTLKDAQKRAHYDRTGHDTQAPRSELQEIAPLVVGAFDRAVKDALQQPFFGGDCLGRTDIVTAMMAHLEADRKRGADANASVEAEAVKVREMQRRLKFTGDEGETNILAAMLNQRLRDGEDLKARNTATIAVVDRAIKHVRLYGWEVEPAPTIVTMSFGMDFQQQTILQMLREQAVFGFGEVYKTKIPVMRPGDDIVVRPPKRLRRRRAHLSNDGLYRRRHTCTLDSDGRQVPTARGSWAEFERRAAEIHNRKEELQWTA